jgi:hypothetical protein
VARIDYLDDPSAPKANSIVPAVSVVMCPFTGVVHWRQLMAGSGGSQGFPAMALLMASSAVMP